MQSQSNDTSPPVNAFVRRRWSLRRTSIAVLIVLFALVGISSAMTRSLVERQEDELLSQRAADVQLVVTQLITQVQGNLQAVGATVTANNGDPDAFARNASQLVSPTSTIYLMTEQGGRLLVRAQAGAASSSTEGFGPEALTAINRAREAKAMAASRVYSISGQRRVGFAFASPAMPPDLAIYLESPLQPVGAPTRVESNAFNEVRVAFYASSEQIVDQVVLATTDRFPLSGRVESRTVPVGQDRWLVSVSPRGALVGSLTENLPWVVLVLFSLVAIALGTVVEVISRRRDDAMGLVQQRSEETASILEAAEDAFISMDEDGNVIRWNRKATDLFGWSLEEVQGRRVMDLIIPDELREQHRRGLELFLATGEGPVLNSRIEVEALRRDGSRFPVELAIWPMQRNGKYIFNAFLHDISVRRRAADELARAHQQAIDASRLKSEFLANMSHEIRTPMNGVIGMTGLLLRTELDVEQREYAETVRASAEALLNVINDILDFSKIEAGRLDLEPVDFDVRTSIEEVADLLADKAHRKNIEMIVEMDRDVPQVLRGDAGRLRQILLNLVANAVKFTDEGEVVIRCELDREALADDDGDGDGDGDGRNDGGRDDGGSEDEETRASSDHLPLRFSVSDTGIGVPESERTAIFETFTQVDASTTKRHEGTGLGLAIVKQLTELMGGTVGVESVEGRGSTFWFTVRLERGNESLLTESAQTIGMAGVRVLVVDDNATNTQILMRTLTEWGMQPSTAENAEEAIDLLEAATSEGHPFELALLDYHMPNVDGLVLAKRITSIPAIARTRLLLLTSSGERTDRLMLREAGVAACLTKPVRHSVLRSRIAEVLQRSTADHDDHVERVDDDDHVEHVESPRSNSSLRASEPFHVLVAEDNVVNQRVAGRMLEKLGCTVDVVANGQEAVDAIARQAYALIFMDCQMPEKDGYEAAAEIRAAETDVHVPIIAMTASAMQGDRELALAAGMDDYLAKPVQLPDVYSALERWALRPSSASVESSHEETNADVLDLRVIDSLRELTTEDGESLLKELAKRFDDNARKQVALLHEAMERADADAIRRAAHALRGSGSTIGARELSELCERLEMESSPEAYDHDGVVADVVRLERLVDLTVRSLMAHVNGKPS